MRIIIAVLLTGGAWSAHAKDLGHRLGVGYADQFGFTRAVPGVALRFHPGNDYAFQLTVGLDTPKNDAKLGLAAKVLRNVFREDNLNFFVAAQGGVISDEDDGRTHSGFTLAGTIGVEFFFTGLENLGFNFEAGVGVNSVSNEVRIRTIGDHPLRAGLFFYF